MRAIWLGILAVLALCGSAWAQVPADPWTMDVEAGLTRARFSGQAAVLVFSANWCGYCEQLEKFFLDARVKPLSDKTVLILVDTAASPDVMKKYNVDGHHQAVVLAWDRTELARLDGTQPPEKLLEKFQKAVLTNEMDAAQVLYKVGRFAKAAQRAQGVLGLVKDGAEALQARGLLDDIRKNAETKLAQARELLKAGRLAECEMACDGMADLFPAKMVAPGLKKLRKDIDLAKAGKPPEKEVPELKPEEVVAKHAQDLVDRGMVAEWDGQVYQAAQMYEKAVRDFAGEKATEDARARLKTLRENPATAELMKKQETDVACRRLLEMARAYSASGHPKEAREYYEKIIKDYPANDLVKTAELEMDELKR